MTKAARERILIAAERLFVERGFEVSLREIAVAAGQRNHSAVQYHFGGKAALIEALYEFRMTPLNRRRHEIIAAIVDSGREENLEALVDAYITPLAEHVLAHRGTSWYQRFINRYTLSGGYRDWPFPSDYYSGIAELAGLLTRRVPGLTDDRLRAVNLHIVAIMADIEQRFADPGFDETRAQAAIADLHRTTLALLTA